MPSFIHFLKETGLFAYLGFCGITVCSVVVVIRAIHFATTQQDPGKALVPDLMRWAFNYEKNKKNVQNLRINS